MANPAPTINQINAFNATQGTTIDFNIIGGTELVRSNRIYIYDLSDNSLICTHLYVSTESIHELPANTDGSILYADGKSSADFVNGAQYYAQIQTFTDIAGTEGGSGLSVAKMFWCLVDPTLTIDAIPSTISTTSYNVSATYDANTSVVSNIIQQYQFNLYNATGSLLQSSGVVVGSGEQQGTSTAYDISYNFTGLSVGSSYYVTVEVTTTQGMSISTQSNTFTISIDTPTLGEATVVNNACDGYISVTSNLSSEYGGSGSGEIVSFETDSENVFTKLQVDLEPIQDLHGYDAPWVGGAGKNLIPSLVPMLKALNVAGVWTDNAYFISGVTFTVNDDGTITVNGTANANIYFNYISASNPVAIKAGSYVLHKTDNADINLSVAKDGSFWASTNTADRTINLATDSAFSAYSYIASGKTISNFILKPMFEYGSTASSWSPYENICPISGHDEVNVSVTDEQKYNFSNVVIGKNWIGGTDATRATLTFDVEPSTQYRVITEGGNFSTILFIRMNNYTQITNIGINPPFNGYITTESNCNKVIVQFQKDTAITASDFDDFKCSISKEYESYHQDIEATYTPTVQENDVYLFKQTGDVGGDRETIELVGGTVAWNQLCNHGNFDESTGWSTGSGTISVSENVASYTLTAVSSSGYGNNIAHRFNAPMGHKMLVRASINPAHNKSAIALWIVGGGSGENIRSKTFAISAGAWTTISDVIVQGRETYPEIQIALNCNNTGYSVGDVDKIKEVNVIDLTQMFGTTIADYIYSLEQGSAGAGVAWFKKLFPKPYYAYNAGELMSVNTSAHNTVGFNAWDEEWELGGIGTDGTPTTNNDRIRSKNYVPIVSNTSYYFRAPSNNWRIFFYDADKNFIEYIGTYSGSRTVTTPSNARYLRFWIVQTTYANDICVNLSWDGERDGEYEEYVKHSYPLDSDLTLRGVPKLDASNNLYYDGDTYESDGTVTRRYGIVDLGTIDWVYDGDEIFRVSDTRMKFMGNGICAKYKWVQVSSWSQVGDGEMSVTNSEQSPILRVHDSTAGTDAAAFKTAMSGVYLVYELATPTTETADAFEEIQKVTPIYGTEEFVDSRTVPMPVYTKTQYLTRDVYGGYIDLVNGLLVLDRGYADLGTIAWTKVTNSIKTYFKSTDEISDMAKSTGNNNIQPINCSHYMTETWTHTLDAVGYNGCICEGWKNRSYIAIYDTTKESLSGSGFKTAMNGVQLVYPLAEPMIFQLTPQQIQTFVGKNNVWSEQGDVEVAYHIPITNLLVKRQDVADVSGDWLTLYSQPITQASDMDFTFIDFTNQYGKTYKYALVPLLTQIQSGVEVEVEGGYTVSDEVQSVFDGVFIVDSTGSQKCKANVGYGNVDMNQTVGTITPIGAKYPIVITNSKNQYHNGSISGTIVPDDYYFNGNLSRIDMVNKRDELEQFLTNKRAKIIKDWNGKIWLVMIMDNVSCTFNNNYGMGIVNFSTNWVEVGDPTNQQDLQETGLIDVGGV